MPVTNGVEAIATPGRVPRSAHRRLTTWDGDTDIHRALEAGARGYLLKDMVSDEVANAIRQVHAGGRAMSQEVSKRPADFTPPDRPHRAGASRC